MLDSVTDNTAEYSNPLLPCREAIMSVHLGPFSIGISTRMKQIVLNLKPKASAWVASLFALPEIEDDDELDETEELERLFALEDPRTTYSQDARGRI